MLLFLLNVCDNPGLKVFYKIYRLGVYTVGNPRRFLGKAYWTGDQLEISFERVTR